jgi:hypothetical protein
MLWGEDRFKGNVYDLAEQATGYKRKTLQEWVYVARHSSMRMEDLSFNHHQVVAALTPEAQRRCLERASADKLAVSELRELARWEPRRLEIQGDDGEKLISLSLKIRVRDVDQLEIMARKRGFKSNSDYSAVGHLI